jgi:hypothetical protein
VRCESDSYSYYLDPFDLLVMGVYMGVASLLGVLGLRFADERCLLCACPCRCNRDSYCSHVQLGSLHLTAWARKLRLSARKGDGWTGLARTMLTMHILSCINQNTIRRCWCIVHVLDNNMHVQLAHPQQREKLRKGRGID